jgi:hypothetical protein
MSVIDLDEYPDGTEEILMALWRYEQARKDDEKQNKWMKRRLLAGRTSLNKQQVRYRLTQLIEDNYVTQDTVTEHNQRVNYYALPPDGKESARAIGEAKDVLGEIPEEITRQDLLKLTNEIAGIRAEIEAKGIEIDDNTQSKFTDKLDKRTNDSIEQWKFIKANEDDITDIWKAVLEIQDEIGIEALSSDKGYNDVDQEPDVW